MRVILDLRDRGLWRARGVGDDAYRDGQGGRRAVLETLLEEVLEGRDHEPEDGSAEVEREEEALEILPKPREGAKMQPEAEDFRGASLYSKVAKDGPSFGQAMLSLHHCFRATSLSHHYSRVKLAKATRT